MCFDIYSRKNSSWELAKSIYKDKMFLHAYKIEWIHNDLFVLATDKGLLSIHINSE